MGNTNFSIHLPRASFDRHATAQVVLRAVRSLGIDAIVNDRNDICVGKDKICLLTLLSCAHACPNLLSTSTSQALRTRSSRTERTIMAPCSSRHGWTHSVSCCVLARCVCMFRSTRLCNFTESLVT